MWGSTTETPQGGGLALQQRMREGLASGSEREVVWDLVASFLLLSLILIFISFPGLFYCFSRFSVKFSFKINLFTCIHLEKTYTRARFLQGLRG